MFNDKIYQLTWEANLGFVYDKNSFEKIDQFKYNHDMYTDHCINECRSIALMKTAKHKCTKKIICNFLSKLNTLFN